MIPGCAIEQIDALLEEHGITWEPGASTTGGNSGSAVERGSTGSTSSTGTSSTSTSSMETNPMGTMSGDGTGDETSSSTDASEETSSTEPVKPMCGDGVVEGGESCDDGNDDPSDGCKQCAKDSVVFVTSEFYQGGKINGLDGADQRCRMLAAIAGLERFETYRAWLSDTKMAATDRLVHSKGRYVLVNGLVVAEDWNGLVSGALLRAIDVDENSETQATVAWTGTLPNGERAPGSSLCDDWTDHSMGQEAGWGVTDEVTMYWSFVNNSDCGVGSTLYCVEQ